MADQALVGARPLKFAVLGLLGLAIWLRAQLAADPLSEVDCAALAALSVFSHRGLSGEGNERPESAIPTAASLVALSERGVAHFDMDLFFTDEAELRKWGTPTNAWNGPINGGDHINGGRTHTIFRPGRSPTALNPNCIRGTIDTM